MEDRHLLGDHLDELHVVLDNNQCAVAGNRANDFCGPRDLSMGHTCGGLIQQHQPRIACKHHTELQPLALSVW